MRYLLKSISKVLIILGMITLVGFTIMSNESAKPMLPVIKTEKITVTNDENSSNSSIVSYINKGTMLASWYGSKFHGKQTANGEVYNQMAFTAASKSLRFGTLLKVTNPKNDRSVIVRVNDRGPYVHGRQLDLSKAAALSLGMAKRGVIRVKVAQLSLKGINFPVINLN